MNDKPQKQSLKQVLARNKSQESLKSSNKNLNQDNKTKFKGMGSLQQSIMNQKAK